MPLNRYNPKMENIRIIKRRKMRTFMILGILVINDVTKSLMPLTLLILLKGLKSRKLLATVNSSPLYTKLNDVNTIIKSSIFHPSLR